jgi:hypothetical protein
MQENNKIIVLDFTSKAKQQVPDNRLKLSNRYTLARNQLDLEPKNFNASVTVKGSKPIVSHMLNVTKILVGQLTPNWVRLCVLLLRAAHKIYIKQGLPGYSKYLKTCSVLVQQVACGYVISDVSAIGPRVSRSKSGIPRLLPVTLRRRIENGDTLAIKWVLTMLAITRVIIYLAPPKLSSITSPRVGSLQMENRIAVLIPKILKYLIRLPKFLSPSEPFPIMTASPNSSLRDNETSTHPLSIIRSRIAFWKNPEMHTIIERMISLTNVDITFKRLWLATSKYVGELAIIMQLGLTPGLGAALASKTSYLGKLGLKQEAAGKVRIFAMVDPFTQWLLRPLHKYLFKNLRLLPMDGTFNQGNPLKRVPVGRPLYSLDLSAATDRLPVSLQQKIIQHLFGEAYAHTWRSLLTLRPYAVKYKDKSGKPINTSVKYEVGQPMGALSSWAMLAITHHLIVQAAAILSNSKFPYKGYALLGDDIVIWDKSVAESYLKIMAGLGLEVNTSKSIISTGGRGLEFAKRTIVGSIDVSPISLKEYSSALENSASLAAFAKKYNIKDSTMKTLLGLGYKSSANTSRWLAWTLIRDIPASPEELLALITKALAVPGQSRAGVINAIKSYMKIITVLRKISEKLHSDVRRKVEEIQGIGYPDNPFSFKRFSQFMEMDWWTLFPAKRISILPDHLDRIYFLTHRKKYSEAVSSLVRIRGYDLPNLIKMIISESQQMFHRPMIKPDMDALRHLISTYYKIDEEVFGHQISKLLSGSPSLRTPMQKDLQRIQKAWNTWSKVVIPKESQSSSFNFFPLIINLIKRIFVVSKNAAQIQAYRSSVGIGKLRQLTSPLSKVFGLRTLIWMWLFESCLAFVFSFSMYYIGLIVWLTITHIWTGGDLKGLFVVFSNLTLIEGLTQNWEQVSLNLFSPTIPVGNSYSSWSVQIYVFTVMMTISHYWEHVVGGFMAVNPSLISIEAIGQSFGIFYYYGIYPVWHILTLPWYAMMGGSHDTLTELLFSNPWIDAYWHLAQGFISSVYQDFFVMLYGYDPYDPEFVIYEDESVWIEESSTLPLDTAPVQTEEVSNRAEWRSYTRPADGESSSSDETVTPDNPHYCNDDCKSYTVVDMIKKSFTGRVIWVMMNHPIILSSVVVYSATFIAKVGISAVS